MTISLDKWEELSKQGDKCGILGCEGQPVWDCPNCSHSYCSEHIKTHLLVCSES